MKKLIPTLLILFTLPVLSCAQVHVDWVHTFGNISDDNGHALSYKAGYIYTTGSFRDTLDFDPSNGLYNIASVSHRDIFVQKLDVNGNLIWAKSMGGIAQDLGRGIAADDFGNVYTIGTFKDTVDFDPNADTLLLSAPGSTSIFIQKLDANGNLVWAGAMGGTYAEGTSIYVDDSGYVYTTGNFLGTMDFDLDSSIYNLTSGGNQDIFIQKLDSSGKLIWAKKVGAFWYDFGLSIVVDQAGSVYTTGTFNSTVDFDPGSGTHYLYTPSNFDEDVFILKLDANGDFLWAKDFGHTGDEYCEDIALDIYGNVYIAGGFSGILDFDPNPLVTNNKISNGGADIFVLKLDSLGNFSWVQTMGGTGYDYGLSIAVDSFGNVLTLGNYEDHVDFNPNMGIDTFRATGFKDIFIQKLDSNGNYLWTQSIGGIQNTSNYAKGLSLDEANNIYFTGGFNNTTDFNPNTANNNIVSSGLYDFFVIKLGDCSNTSSIDTITSCTPYTWMDGNSYTSSNNTATYTVPNYAGCDSVITLNLTVNNHSSSTDTIVSCTPYTWIDGNTYTSNNDLATYTLPNHTGCDSVITLNLVVNGHSSSIDNISSCTPYTWMDGNTYTSSNDTATYTIPNYTGCDSLITLNLIVNSHSFSSDTIVTCDAYIWINGLTYFSSNSSTTHTIPNATGCDSIVSLNLTINSINTALSQNGLTLSSYESNASYQWLDCNNNLAPLVGETAQTFTATANGSYAVSITNNAGCSDISNCIQILGLDTDHLFSNTNETTVQLYPNPTNGKTYVELLGDKILSLSVYGIDGKLIYQKSAIMTEKHQLDLGLMPPSVYLIKVITVNNRHYYKYLIKK